MIPHLVPLLVFVSWWIQDPAATVYVNPPPSTQPPGRALASRLQCVQRQIGPNWSLYHSAVLDTHEELIVYLGRQNCRHEARRDLRDHRRSTPHVTNKET